MKRSPFSNSLAWGRAAVREIPIWIWIVPLALIGPALLPGKAIYFGTISLQFHPWRALAWRSILSGELPLWNPLSGMGAPLLANYQSALLYPPTWLLFAFGAIGGETAMAYGQGWLVVLHLVLAGWGMARLVRALGLPVFSQALAGLAFGCSGYLVARSHFLSINAAAAWLPWVLLYTYRLAGAASDGRARPAVRLAVVLALLLLAGHAQTAWYILLLAGVWLVFWLLQIDFAAHSHRHNFTPHIAAEIPTQEADSAGADPSDSRRFGRLAPAVYFAAALGIAILIAAAQLLPTAELLRLSSRTGGVEQGFAMTYSFWPWRLLGLLSPGLFGSPVSGDYWGYANFWEDAVYIGLIPLALALQAIRTHLRGSERTPLVRFLAAIVLVSFLLALGSNTPIFPFLYRHVPTFDLFQAPTRCSLLAVFGLSLLAGIGAADWAAAQSSLARIRARRWSAAGLALILSGSVTLIFLPQIPASFGRSILVTGVFATAAALFGTAKTKGHRWRTAVTAAVALDLAVAGWGLNPPTDLDFYRPQSPPDAAVYQSRVHLPEQEIYRLTFDDYFRFGAFAADLSGLRETQLPNLNIVDGIASAGQFDPLEVGRYAAWMALLESAQPDLQLWMLAQSSVDSVGLSVAPGRMLWIDLDPAPRVEWFPCARPAVDPDHAARLVLARDPAFSNAIVIEDLEPGSAGSCGAAAAGGNGDAELVSAGLNGLEIRIMADDSGWLLVRDTYEPGWTVFVDGAAGEVLPANVLFRAVRVPAGEHTVELVYRPAALSLGLALSLAGLGTLVYIARKFRLPVA